MPANPTPVKPPAERGPAVPAAETLLRAVPPAAAGVQLPGGVPSSALFNRPCQSSDIESLTTVAGFLARWPAGSVAVRYSTGVAREHGFDARHEPEPLSDTDPTVNHAHANVYSDATDKERKKKARDLAAHATTGVVPAG